MIKIADKTQCCGCEACAQKCPKHCISMLSDNEGFYYPTIDVDSCIDCDLCEKVCPVINRFEPNTIEPECYACRHKNQDIVNKSSSGGIFTSLAEYVISQGGVVFGARFTEDWMVVHDYAEDLEGLIKFRGSKYIHSVMNNSYQQAESFLKADRLVLFTGTPCQIAGLNHFLRKMYHNLISVDLICHSISSPLVWRRYLDHILLKHNKKAIGFITFKDKSEGWKRYGLKIVDDGGTILMRGAHQNNLYMRGFLSNLYTKPSCSQCPARNYTSGSDITIGDCWGLDQYHPQNDDDKGMSVALLLTDKGKNIFEAIQYNMDSFLIPYDEVEAEGLHSPLTKSTKFHKNRPLFFMDLNKYSLSLLFFRYLQIDEFANMMKNRLKKIVKYLLCRKRK